VKFQVTTNPLIHDPGFTALKNHLIESTGLAYYSDKDNDLATRISARLSELKLKDCRSYLSLLTNNEDGGTERHLLISQLTIGETYFFRHTEQFDAIRDLVLPEVLDRNRDCRTLRIWSAGCSIGAEPYSLAILLKDVFAERLVDWDVRILGTDINQTFLARAARGEFDENALRSTSDEFRQRWFSRQGKFWHVNPALKEWVSFQHHNLVEHPYPSIVHGITALDLIVCRNVMIYFDWNHIREIIGKFHECLVPGGWLAVGHAESNTEVFQDYQTVDAPGATLYRKKGDPLSTSSIQPVLLPAEWTPPSLPAVPDNLPGTADRSVDKPVLTGLARIRQFAEEGKWIEASRCCDESIQTDRLNPSLYFYQALIVEQLGHYSESERALRRALYLDRNFVLAHYHLALLLRRAGNIEGALQSLNNVRDLLSRMDQQQIADGDGITAEELGQLTAIQLELLKP
jgi:chemotaxis protein methyltransferase CheR